MQNSSIACMAGKIGMISSLCWIVSFILFPIGGALHGPAQLMRAVAVLATARWGGWQRWMPLIYSIYAILAVGLPMVLGLAPNGPGMNIEIGQGACWFLVALAVYTMQAKAVDPQRATLIHAH